MSPCSKFHHLLQRWRKKATTLTSRRRTPIDVPSGHIAVTVGSNCKRYVVRVTYLNHPIFKKLLSQVEEEYGFTNSGPLDIPNCDESFFEELLRYLARFDSDNNNNNVASSIKKYYEDFRRNCHMDIRKNLDFWGDSRPLLHSVSDKSVW